MKINFEIENRRIWSFLGLIVVGVFAYFQAIGYLIPGFKLIFYVNPEIGNIANIGLMWVPVIAYLLIGTVIAFIVNIFKKERLKSFGEDGLIYYLFVGFCLGLAMGIFFFMALGNILSFCMGISLGFIAGGFLVGFVLGLNQEFRK